MRIIGIIPARFASTRFPGKPLANIYGKTMIRRVYENAKKVLDYVLVATDDSRIYDEVISFGGKVMMTAENHKSGTDRCQEALLKFQNQESLIFDIVINVQGDEPFVEEAQLNALINCFDDQNTEIATLVKRIETYEELISADTPKVIFNGDNKAIYFSRNPIPFLRGYETQKWISHQNYYKHIGLYAYKANVLGEITRLKPSFLENSEKLEQLRWLENGYSITIAETDKESLSIDTPEDLEKVLRIFS